MFPNIEHMPTCCDALALPPEYPPSAMIAYQIFRKSLRHQIAVIRQPLEAEASGQNELRLCSFIQKAIINTYSQIN